MNALRDGASSSRSDSPRPDLRILGKTQSFTLVAGSIVALLAIGLVLPFVFGESPESFTTTVSSITSNGPSTTSGDPLDAAAPAVSEPAGGDAERGPGGASGGVSGGVLGGIGGPGSPGVKLTASDRGVSTTEIKIGIGLLDTGGLGAAGLNVEGISLEDQQVSWQAYIDEVNAAGGVLGRKLVARFRSYDILQADTMRSACLYWTQDEKVFAVMDIGSFFGPAILCITEENETPFFGGGLTMPLDFIPRSAGRLFTLAQRGDRTMANFVAELDRLGHLRGHTIGVLSDDLSDPGARTINGALISTLEARGYRVARHGHLDANIGASASQVPVEVQQMKLAGVDTVLLLSHSVAQIQFIQDAQSNGWRPKYFITDWASNPSIVAEAAPDSFDGTISITSGREGEWRVGIREPETEAGCREIWQRRTGLQMSYDNRDANKIDYSIGILPCTYIGMFGRAAAAVGPKLSRQGWSQSMQATGPFSMVLRGDGSFAQGKFDGADHVRPVQWRSTGCKCGIPVGDFRRTEF